MAHKKAGGSTRNGRDSQSKRLGVKVYGGQAINAGGIIIRQRELSFTQVTMLVLVKTTRCLQKRRVKCSLYKKARSIVNMLK